MVRRSSQSIAYGLQLVIIRDRCSELQHLAWLAEGSDERAPPREETPKDLQQTFGSPVKIRTKVSRHVDILLRRSGERPGQAHGLFLTAHSLDW